VRGWEEWTPENAVEVTDARGSVDALKERVQRVALADRRASLNWQRER
jgi:hypothetical protein